MAENKDIDFGMPSGIPQGKVIELYPKGHKTSHKSPKEAKPKLTRKQKFIKRTAVPLALVTAGVVTGEAVKPFETAGHKIQEFLGANDIKTYPFREIKSLDSFKEDVEGQFEVGKQVAIEDLVIAVPQDSPSLKIRYYAKTLLDSAEGETGGIAVEVPAGKMLEIKNAAIVNGERVDPNDPLSNSWFAVNLQQFGLEGYGYISNSSFTRSAITPRNLETVTIAKKGENGTLFFNKDGKDLPVGKVKI